MSFSLNHPYLPTNLPFLSMLCLPVMPTLSSYKLEWTSQPSLGQKMKWVDRYPFPAHGIYFITSPLLVFRCFLSPSLRFLHHTIHSGFQFSIFLLTSFLVTIFILAFSSAMIFKKLDQTQQCSMNQLQLPNKRVKKTTLLSPLGSK